MNLSQLKAMAKEAKGLANLYFVADTTDPKVIKRNEGDKSVFVISRDNKWVWSNLVFMENEKEYSTLEELIKNSPVDLKSIVLNQIVSTITPEEQQEYVFMKELKWFETHGHTIKSFDTFQEVINFYKDMRKEIMIWQ